MGFLRELCDLLCKIRFLSVSICSLPAIASRDGWFICGLYGDLGVFAALREIFLRGLWVLGQWMSDPMWEDEAL
jgi:hypothetical protein